MWFDEGSVFLRTFQSSSELPEASRDATDSRSAIASSATAVATPRNGDGEEGDENEEGQFLGGVPPRPLHVIRPPRLFSGGGCRGWQPRTGRGGFVLAGDELVAAAECHWDDPSVRQPLLVRNLLGGAWRVLRWLPGDYKPVLAAEGNLLAVGLEGSFDRMDTSILDVRSGGTEARFVLPEGELAFASPERLVLSMPQLLSSPELHGLERWSGPFELALYSTQGRRIGSLGSAREPPLVSGMHIVAEEDDTVFVRSLTGGARRPVVGFDAPARELDALAFRWPALVVVEATSKPLLSSEIQCWSGDYAPPGKPFLGIFDLARSEPFAPAPALVHVEPSKPLTDCGPPPR